MGLGAEGSGISICQASLTGQLGTGVRIQEWGSLRGRRLIHEAMTAGSPGESELLTKQKTNTQPNPPL